MPHPGLANHCACGVTRKFPAGEGPARVHPGRIRSRARLVEGFFQLRDLGEFNLKGAQAPVHVFELEGAGALRTRLDLSRARGFSKFVGRTDEVATLEAALEHALGGRGQVVGVVAEAGVGKSRLCFEFP